MYQELGKYIHILSSFFLGRRAWLNTQMSKEWEVTIKGLCTKAVHEYQI
jgi:hypothetical protein